MNVDKAIINGKIPFKVTKGDQVRYTFGSSQEQMERRYKGWKVEPISLIEYEENKNGT